MLPPEVAMGFAARLAVPLLFALCSSTAWAVPCSGFGDVDSTNPACPSVDWLKNRGVTTGCTVGQYCPSDPVTRLQMALFMNRLALALEPDFVTQSNLNAEGNLNGATQGFVCETAPYVVTGYARVVTPVGATLHHGSPVVSDISTRLVYRNPPSTQWFDWGFFSRASNASGQFASQAPTAGPLNLQVGETYAFAIRASSGTQMALSVAQCALAVRIDNRN